MKITIVILVSLNSILQFHTTSSTCETKMEKKNIHNEGRKFHLKDSRSNKYIVVESSTMLVRAISSAEFEHFIQNEITWFTACNDFEPINFTLRYFDICIAGTEDKRLFYDEIFGIFMFLNQETRDTDQTPRRLMNMRLVPNVRANSFEYASLFYNGGQGHLQLENNLIGIGTETLFMTEE